MTKTPIELVEKWRKESNLLSDKSCDASNGRKPFTAERLRTSSAYVAICANELEAAIAAQWIPVEERLPLTPTNVWVAFGYGTMRECGYFLNGNWFLRGSRMPGVTHWMPIPPLLEKKS